MNIINRILFYRDYKKSLKKIKKTLQNKYNITFNIFNEFYTVIDLNDVPDVVKAEYGITWRERELSHFISLISKECKAVNIIEELEILEVVEQSENVFGICFGFKPDILNVRYYFYTKIILSIISLLTLIILTL